MFFVSSEAGGMFEMVSDVWSVMVEMTGRKFKNAMKIISGHTEF